ncbi:hypothetical protein C1H46_010907 [Malus baccata]|uniref:Uncharacterized protein n=1 Tax=Malus baccata TaxID=106549 RepID=A0A540MXR9_MALBA|nr:hypothetical protein C1H46_010907 [Malus baccata]
MKLTSSPHHCIWSSPIHLSSSSHRSLLISISPRKTKLLRSIPSFRLIRRRNLCSASNFKKLVGSWKEDSGKEIQVVSKKDEEEDLKSWMHENGLPPCKVVLKEKPSYDEKLRSIHYAAASEDLELLDDDASVFVLFLMTPHQTPTRPDFSISDDASMIHLHPEPLPEPELHRHGLALPWPPTQR